MDGYAYLVDCWKNGKKPSGKKLIGKNIDYGKAYCEAFSIPWPICECGEKIPYNNGFGKYCSKTCYQKSMSLRNTKTNALRNKMEAEKKLKSYIKDNADKLQLAIFDYVNTDMSIKDIKKTRSISISLSSFFKSIGVFNRNRRKVIVSSQSNDTISYAKSMLDDLDWVEHMIKIGYGSKELSEYLNVSPNFVAKYLRDNYTKTPLDVNRSSSLLESRVASYLDSLGVEYIRNSYSVISPYELDFYIPSRRVAIEINGIYWHSEIFKEKDYHLTKHTLCENAGIRLMQFYCFEIENKFELVKSMIKSSLGLLDKIYARECKIVELTSKEYSQFLNKNHIQNSVNSSYRYGLVHDGKIVSVMGFSKSRFKSKEEFELMRFANAINTTVIGGANKLYRNFIKKQQPKSIVSYCQKRLFTGNMYEKIGMRYHKSTPPNYFWAKGADIKTRYQTQKHRLNTKVSEKEHMTSLGYYRVFDCGQRRYVYNDY